MIERILLDLSLDIGHKQDKLLEILVKKSLEFNENNKNNTIAFNLSFVLLLTKIDLILEP